MQSQNEPSAMKVAIEICEEFAEHWEQQARSGDNTGASDHRADAARQIIAELRNVNTAPPAQTALTDAARDVLAERCRQVEAEGFTTARDDGYADGQLAQAGAAYALAVADHTNHTINSGAAFYTRSPDIWPWSEKWWKPTSPRRALVKAGALILAEIERLDRRALTAAQSASGESHADKA